jgi:PKD repeat protein
MNNTSSYCLGGIPKLPVKPLQILLPQKGIVKSINVTFTGNTSMGENYNVLLGNLTRVISDPIQNSSNESYFNSSIPYPPELFKNYGTQSFRGYSLLFLNLYPVHYVGDTGKIYYYKNMTITINTNNTGPVNPFFRNLSCDETSMKQIADDYSMIYTYTSVPEPQGNSTLIKSNKKYDFVIITREKFVDAPALGRQDWHTFKELNESKNNVNNPNHIKTIIKTVESIKNDDAYRWDGTWGDRNDWGNHDEDFKDTACRIRNFIRHAADSHYWGAKYFLLGGDHEDELGRELLPARKLWFTFVSGGFATWRGNVSSDIYYACYDKGTFDGDKDEKWGEHLDGAYNNDLMQPPNRDGDWYAEADSLYNDDKKPYEVGLFTNASNLGDYEGALKVTFNCNFFKSEDGSAEVKIYSGGKTDPDDLDLSYELPEGSRTFRWDIHTDDIEYDNEVYIEFYFKGSSKNGSFDIDDVNFGTPNVINEWIDEDFETEWVVNNDGESVPHSDWDQHSYIQNGGFWEQVHYPKPLELLISDIYVGRVPVGNAREVSNYVSKILKYEDATQIQNNDKFLDNALFIGGRMRYNENPNEPWQWGGTYCDKIIKIVKDNQNFKDYRELYDRNYLPSDPDLPMWSSEELRKTIHNSENLCDDTYHIMYDFNHGWTSKIIRNLVEKKIVLSKSRLKYSDIPIYFCNEKPFLFVSNSCLIGGFANYYPHLWWRKQHIEEEGMTKPWKDCLGEYLTVKTEYGAFASILNTRVGLESQGFKIQENFFKELCENKDNRLGQIFTDTKNIYVESNEVYEDSDYRYLFYNINLIGDPTVKIRRLESANNDPNAPCGLDYETFSKVGNLYKYICTARSTDPDGDRVSYKWKWDDHECLFWTKYYDSGANGSRVLWLPSGTHNIRVKSRDIFLNESNWSDNLTVTVSFTSDMDIVSSPTVLGKQTQFYGKALDVAEDNLIWYYTFGDGNYSNQQNTNHCYGEIGTYNVTLTATEGSITSNVSKAVKVVILKSDINSSSDYGIPNETISFKDLSDGYYNITNWHWDFGDGNTSNNQNTSHVYATEGIYNVSLNVTDTESTHHMSYQTIYIDTGDPQITSISSDLNKVGYGYNITITANLSDSVSGIKTATVNVTYPDNTHGNYTLNNINGSTYEYVFNDTSQLGDYSYIVWAVDHAGNLDCTAKSNFTVLRSFGFRMTGSSNESILDTVTGSKFKVNLKGVADNVSVYLDPGNATTDSHYQCMIYRHNDSKLMGISEEKNVTSGKGWQIFNFSVPKPVLMNDTEYILSCWADNHTIRMYFDNGTGDEMFFDDGTSTLQGHYFRGIYNYTPDLIYFDHEDRKYTIYCRYTPDNTPPMITNIFDTPDTVGFGFNVSINVNVNDNASGVNIVKINITYPNNTTGNFTMNNTTGNSTYKYNFSGTWLSGQYNYTIWTVDYAGNSNSSSGHSFNVSAQATLTIATLKDNYGANEYINLTDPPVPSNAYYLVGRGEMWNEYYDATSSRNVLEIFTSSVNYQDESGNWNPIKCNISLIDNSHPAYGYGYRAGNEHGLYHVYFKPNAQDNWPVTLAYNKSTEPSKHVVRSKLVGVGYIDPSQNWTYEYLQSVQSSQGQIDGHSATYKNVFTGTDVVWTYDRTSLKEEIIMSKTTKTVLQNHPPSEYGLSNQHSYLVFITKLDYHNLQLYNLSGVLTGNFTTSKGIDFKNALGHFKCALPIGEAYELHDESVRQHLTYRILQYNSNNYLLSGLKVTDLNSMTFPVVIDPTLTVTSSSNDGDITGDGTPYSIVQAAAEGSPIDSATTFSIGQKNDSMGPPPPPPIYFIYRGFVYFDTSSIPSNDLIDSVTLKLYKDSDFSITDFDIVVQNGQPTYPHTPMVPGDYNKNHYSGNGGSLNTASFSSGYNSITLTNYSWINTSGTTKLCLRSSRDIDSIEPTGDEYVMIRSSATEGQEPKLVIEYRNQSKIKNTGSTDIKGYLLMQVQYYNTSVFCVDHNTINETTPRIINSSEQLALDLIFNGLVNTNNLTHGSGTYRVYAAFRDPEGNILKCNDETELVATYEFTVTF